MIIAFNLFRGLIRFFTVFFRIRVNYLVGGILMGMFLSLGGWRVLSGLRGLVYWAGFIGVLLPLIGVLLYELGVTYFQLALFFFLNLEYSAESWRGSAFWRRAP